MKKIILASSSLRRIEILKKLNIKFEIIPADIDESNKKDELPIQYVNRLSIEKALKVSSVNNNAIVIGSDLTCDLDNKSIGKASNNIEAYEILKNFSGKIHYGRCGYAIVINNNVIYSGVNSTIVKFKKLSDNKIHKYIESGEWKGLAGAYGIQNSAKYFIDDFRGSYFDLMGLPIYKIAESLISLNYPINYNLIESIRNEDNKLSKLLNNGK